MQQKQLRLQPGEMEGSWEMCAHRMMDAHTRVTPVIYSVVPISVPYLQSNPTTFTNMISLQRDFMYTEEIINLICVTVYRLQLLSIILL